MDSGIKVAKPGYDITGKQGKRDEASSNQDKAHMLYVLATPYVMGAHVQVERYKQTASTLESQGLIAAQACLHEVSCLFEDLATISQYTKLCGDSHERDDLWNTVRGHIRHDIRERFDSESSYRKAEAAKKLGIPDHLQTNIGFSETAIKVGAREIALSDIEAYIAWAAQVITDTVNAAREKGLVNESPIEA